MVLGLLLFILIGIYVSIRDFRTHTIPNFATLAQILIFILFPSSASLLRSIEFTFLALLMLLLPSLMARGAIGMGDVKYFAGIGTFLAQDGYSELFVALQLACISAFLALLYFKLKKLHMSNIAFGPHLFFGGLLAHLL